MQPFATGMMHSIQINGNILGWVRLSVWAAGALYLWRSALRPREEEPTNARDRVLRLIGAALATFVVIYFIGYGFGLYSYHHR